MTMWFQHFKYTTILILYLHLDLSECFFNYHTLDDHESWDMLPTKACGISRNRKRIVGGKEAFLGQFPWIARLAYRFDNKIEFKCAGNLISRRFVITAAHCVTGEDALALFFIRLGENYSNKHVDCDKNICAPPPQDIRPSKMMVHSRFSKTSYLNDIAVIKLKRNVILNDFVRPICLPRERQLNQNHYITGHVLVAGWGETNSTNSKVSTKLLYVSLPVIDLKHCRRIYKEFPIRDGQYCVGVGKGKDSCGGDSGGPMMKAMFLDGSTRFFLLGIVSFGMEICGYTPAIYTNIGYYMKWILDNLSADRF